MTSSKKPRVLLADDDSLVVAGLRATLEPCYEVVEAANTGWALVRAAERLNPEVVLMDIVMPELSGVEAAKQLRRTVPTAKLIFLTMHTDGGRFAKL